MSKYTIITREIDGYDVIFNIGRAMIDLEKTKPIVNDFMVTTDVHKQIESYKTEILGYAQAAAVSKAAAKKATNDKEKQKHADEMRARLLQIETIQNEKLKPLGAEYVALRKQKLSDLAVYQQPGSGETVIDNGEEIIEQLRQAVQNGQVLTSDGEFIDDYRGKTYYKKSGGKWLVQIIEKLGDTPLDGATETLTDDHKAELLEQMETERVSKLSHADREDEKSAKIDAAATQAASMRSKLEIQGTTADKALKESQKWYADRVKEIEKKYGA